MKPVWPFPEKKPPADSDYLINNLLPRQCPVVRIVYEDRIETGLSCYSFSLWERLLLLFRGRMWLEQEGPIVGYRATRPSVVDPRFDNGEWI